MPYQRKAGIKKTIWRINHRPEDFLSEELSRFLEEQIIVVKNTLIEELKAIRKEDFFYLHHGNQNQCIKLLGKIIDDVPEQCPNNNECFQRHYELLCKPLNTVCKGTRYGHHTPLSPIIIYEISLKESSELEKDILRPYFDKRIKNLTGLWSAETFPSILSKKIFPLNQILYGVPGTGKTYSTTSYAVAICNNKKLDELADYAEIKREYDKLKTEGRIAFTTFHQSYGYEDFIEGIKPDLNDGGIKYKCKAGVFKKFCEHAAENPDKNFVFIIDEINRGNISKIFGELITLIEDDKREEFSVILPTSQEEFTVPKNVYLLGTMNTSDRSIALLDSALRRRFDFIELEPRPEVLETVDGVNLEEILRNMNAQIEKFLDRDHRIGHAYFINCKSRADIDLVFERKIIPLLREYFFEDETRINEVLPEGYKL